MTQLLNFRRCHGCGKLSKEVRLLVSLPAEIHVCDECVLTMVAIVANQAVVEARIHFVDELQQILREPIEVVAKWKEAQERKQVATTDSKGGL